MSRIAAAVFGLVGLREHVRLRLGDDGAAARDDLLDELRLHHDALVRDPGGDHRHLQRRHEHPLLPEGEAARVDRAFGFFGSKSLRFTGRRARDARPRVGRRLERRRRVEAELLRLLEHLRGAERLADVAEDRVDRVLERLVRG